MSNPPIQVTNLTRNTTLVSRGRVADSYFPRLIGLMGHAPLQEGEGLIIAPCNSIHTHFMRFAIDVLYVNREGDIVAMDQAMAPWRFGKVHRGARYVVELPAGTIAATGTQVGDRVSVEGWHAKL
jgi:uncharacterized membrane protein (UPF0127 family)